MKDKGTHFILRKSGYGKEYHELFMKEINGDKVYSLEYDKETTNKWLELKGSDKE